MVIIVKKLVPIFRQWDNVPKHYHNLRKAVYVTSFKYLYPNIPKILVEQYGLKPDEKIVVFWTKEISLPHFRRYRVKFKRIYSGPLSQFGKHMDKIRRKRTKKSSQRTADLPREDENQHNPQPGLHQRNEQTSKREC